MSTLENTNFKSINSTALIGFDELFKRIHELEKPNIGYPPYNIIREDANLFKIVMAVAGFSKNNITITLEAGKLTIFGSVDENQPVVTYIYKGIAERGFKREFTVADTVEVGRITLVDGILTINLLNIVPEHKKKKLFYVE